MIRIHNPRQGKFICKISMAINVQIYPQKKLYLRSVSTYFRKLDSKLYFYETSKNRELSCYNLKSMLDL